MALEAIAASIMSTGLSGNISLFLKLSTTTKNICLQQFPCHFLKPQTYHLFFTVYRVFFTVYGSKSHRNSGWKMGCWQMSKIFK